MSKVDVSKNREAQKWSQREMLGRVLWAFASPLFRWSPRICWEWRCYILRLFGAKIGRGVHIYPSVRILIPWNVSLGDESAIGDRAIIYALGLISVGQRATVSQGAHLCAGSHDIRSPSRDLLKPPITIGNDAWICADAFVGPNVTVGSGAIVGARAVVVRDVGPGATVVGNPARPI